MKNVSQVDEQPSSSAGSSTGNAVSGQPQEESSTSCPSKKRKKMEDGFAESTGSQAKFHNISVEDIIIIEICAGSARLTKAARAMGFKGVAVDHSDKRSCGVDICIFDLTDPLQLQDLLDT